MPPVMLWAIYKPEEPLFQGMDTDGHYQKIISEVPLAELKDYGSTFVH